MEIKFKPIGTIKTPYIKNAPPQGVETADGEFRIIINHRFREGLFKLEKFRYIYVVYYMDRLKKQSSMKVTPPWISGDQVGLFASRSPVRPNSIGISVVKLKKIIENKIVISGIDAFNDTPLLDIKPYVKELDSKEDANYGWLEESKGNREHLLKHIRNELHED
ncbi:MAG: tRNA (N6-threonylcarbamoyladenosine(37)-N6)-methyltransferase TrmO [Elusimicrobiota bacterium]